MYFPGNSPFLISFSSILPSFSCHLTSALILPSNSATTSFVFSKSSSFSHMSCSTVNPFYHTRYFTTCLIFCLFKILSTFHFFTSSTSTGFASFTFYSFTCFLYYTTQLMFTTGCILIEVSSCNLTALVDTTSLMVYGPIYQSTNFLASCSLNTRSFILNITLSLFFYSSTSLLLLSTCHFISS